MDYFSYSVVLKLQLDVEKEQKFFYPNFIIPFFSFLHGIKYFWEVDKEKRRKLKKKDKKRNEKSLFLVKKDSHLFSLNDNFLSTVHDSFVSE